MLSEIIEVKGLEEGGKERRKRVSKCSEEEGYITELKGNVSRAVAVTRARKGKVACGHNSSIISAPPHIVWSRNIGLKGLPLK